MRGNSKKVMRQMVRVQVATSRRAPVNEHARLWRDKKFDQGIGTTHDDPFWFLYGTPEQAQERLAKARSQEPKSDVLPDDIFTAGVSMVGSCPILVPPDDPRYLAYLLKLSAALRSCVDAQVQNTVGYGFELVDREGMVPENDTEAKEKADEKVMLEDFFENIHPHMSWIEIKKRQETDCEAAGRGFLEVIDEIGKRDSDEPTLFGFDHIPTRNMRLSTEDVEPAKAKAWKFDRRKRNWVEAEYYHRFRRFVNLSPNMSGSPIIRYFAEFGDPRFVDKTTGAFFMKRGADGRDEYITAWKDLTEDQRKKVANQVWAKLVYDAEQPQGAPRWMAAKIDIEASYSSREATWDYLDNGAIPQLLLLVSGGAAYDDAVARVEDALDRTKGNHASNRVVVLDATSVQASNSGGGLPGDDLARFPTIKIEAVKLNDLQRGDDAMFLNFNERVDLNVRKCFRFGSLFVGDNDGATYATAEVILMLAEMQCFGPARLEDDWRMNHLVFPRLKARWWKYRSKGPRIEDPASWIRVVEFSVQTGAIKDYPTLCAILSEKLGRVLDVPRDDKGEPLPWTSQPPGFVSALVRALGTMPTGMDIQNVVAGLMPEGGGGQQTARSAADAVAERVAALMLRSREIAVGMVTGRRPA